jgi:hypothetical protein
MFLRWFRTANLQELDVDILAERDCIVDSEQLWQCSELPSRPDENSTDTLDSKVAAK